MVDPVSAVLTNEGEDIEQLLAEFQVGEAENDHLVEEELSVFRVAFQFDDYLPLFFIRLEVRVRELLLQDLVLFDQFFGGFGHLELGHVTVQAHVRIVRRKVNWQEFISQLDDEHVLIEVQGILVVVVELQVLLLNVAVEDSLDSGHRDLHLWYVV